MSHDSLHSAPVIGVLCIDVACALSKTYGADIKSYIAASYVKFLESAGAKVVPVWIGRARSYYDDLLRKINGVLIPGGSVFFDTQSCTAATPNDCVQSACYIYEIAVQLNAAGNHFAVWGTCLGYGLLMYAANACNDLRQNCEHMSCALPLTFGNDFRNSKLFGDLDAAMEKQMREVPFGYHKHRYCITKAALEKSAIKADWHVLATNNDGNGVDFITILEHTKYPFFGAQIHLECICYEHYNKNDGCDHSAQSVELAAYFARFFVNVCRNCSNRFANKAEELRHSIMNFTPKFTACHGAPWQQCYLFEQTTDYVAPSAGDVVPKT